MIKESSSDWLTTADVARMLHRSDARVRQLIGSGDLAACRVGGRYLVSRDDVEARLEAGGLPGRPFSARRAWGLILLAAELPAPGLDPVTVSKLRAVLRDRDLWVLRPRLARRAERRTLRAHSSDLGRLEAEPGVVLTGARHAGAAGLGLVAPEAPLELYVDEDAAHRLVARYRLQPADRPNVVLRVVSREIRSWLPGRVAPRPAVALDLADDRDPRAQLVAREALSRP